MDDIKNFLENESKFLTVIGIFAIFVTLVIQIPFDPTEQKTYQLGEQEITITLPSAVNQNIRTIQGSVIFLFVLLIIIFCVRCFKSALESSSHIFLIFALISLQSLFLLLILFLRRYDYLFFSILSPIILFSMCILGMKVQDYLISKFRMISFVFAVVALILLFLIYLNPFDMIRKIALFLFDIFIYVFDESNVDVVIDYLLDIFGLILKGISYGVLISTLTKYKKMFSSKNK